MSLTWSKPDGTWGINGVNLATLPLGAYSAVMKLHHMEKLIELICNPKTDEWEREDSLRDLLGTRLQNEKIKWAQICKLGEKFAYYEGLQKQGRLVALPCKAGDTVYMCIPADCRSGMCQDVDTELCKYSAFHSPTDDVITCKIKHTCVEEIYIDCIAYISSEKRCYLSINEWLEATAAEIHKTRQEAEAALAKEIEAALAGAEATL